MFSTYNRRIFSYKVTYDVSWIQLFEPQRKIGQLGAIIIAEDHALHKRAVLICTFFHIYDAAIQLPVRKDSHC